MSGIENFAKSLIAARELMISQASRGMQIATLTVSGTAKKYCPSNTGALRRSIGQSVEVGQGKIIGRVYSNLKYAPFVHQGTGLFAADGTGRKTAWRYYVKGGKYKGWHTTQGQRPTPFMQRAIDHHRDDISKLVGEQCTGGSVK